MFSIWNKQTTCQIDNHTGYKWKNTVYPLVFYILCRNHCNKDLNDHTDPLYQDSLFINQYVNQNSSIHLKISKNDQVIYEATPNKFKMWSFTLRKKFE